MELIRKKGQTPSKKKEYWMTLNIFIMVKQNKIPRIKKIKKKKKPTLYTCSREIQCLENVDRHEYSLQASLPSISSVADRIGVIGGWSPASVPDRGLA